jgi:GTP-binding protein Era
MYARKPEFLEHDVRPILPALQSEKRPVLIVVNKIDLLGDKSRLLPLLEALHAAVPEAEIFPLSALTRNGLPELLAFLKKTLPEKAAQFPDDQLSTLPSRFMAAELVREKLFLSMRQELPYFTAVDIERWEEDPGKNLTLVHAVIYVGKASHKGMVIGRGGKNLKQVGESARKEMEILLGTKVYLELWVKLKENWPEDLNFLHSLGLGRSE